MQAQDYDEVVSLIRKEDPRYDRGAYHFIRLGLDFTVKALKEKEPRRAKQSLHVSGPELLAGLRDYALDQYGPLARTVLEAWGVRRCTDFGEIVFNLIEYDVFSKTENDRREDFGDIFSFEEAFEAPFRPQRPRPASRVEDVATS